MTMPAILINSVVSKRSWRREGASSVEIAFSSWSLFDLLQVRAQRIDEQLFGVARPAFGFAEAMAHRLNPLPPSQPRALGVISGLGQTWRCDDRATRRAHEVKFLKVKGGHCRLEPGVHGVPNALGHRFLARTGFDDRAPLRLRCSKHKVGLT